MARAKGNDVRMLRANSQEVLDLVLIRDDALPHFQDTITDDLLDALRQLTATWTTHYPSSVLQTPPDPYAGDGQQCEARDTAEPQPK
jgi:hypothetical protein